MSLDELCKSTAEKFELFKQSLRPEPSEMLEQLAVHTAYFVFFESMEKQIQPRYVKLSDKYTSLMQRTQKHVQNYKQMNLPKRHKRKYIRKLTRELLALTPTYIKAREHLLLAKLGKEIAENAMHLTKYAGSELALTQMKEHQGDLLKIVKAYQEVYANDLGQCITNTFPPRAEY